MSVQAPERPTERGHVGLFSPGLMTRERPTYSRGKSSHAGSSGKDVLIVTDEPVFRSGTFRDSMGFQSTWEDLHMEQMVLNYNHLAGKGILADIPVRKGHGSFLGDPMETLIGWHTGLKTEDRESPHDGKTYRYLLASFEIFDPTAAVNVEAGNWRNRSSEVGYYLTNDEAEFWPTYLGFAFVDIPAVEGLNGFSNAVNRNTKFSIMMEAPVGNQNGNGGQGDQSTDQQAGASGTETQQDVEQQAANTAQQTAANDQGTNQSQEGSPTGQPGGEGAGAGTGTPPAADQNGSEQNQQPQQGQHSAASNAFGFMIGGQRTTDYSAVQAHINQLETTQSEAQSSYRENFVRWLAHTKKISASDLDKHIAFAKDLSDEAFTQWSQLQGGAPEMGLFGQYGSSGAGDEGAPQSQNEKQENQETENLVMTVRNHMRTMPKENVKRTGSFTKLKQAVGDDKLRELGFGSLL